MPEVLRKDGTDDAENVRRESFVLEKYIRGSDTEEETKKSVCEGGASNEHASQEEIRSWPEI